MTKIIRLINWTRRMLWTVTRCCICWWDKRDVHHLTIYTLPGNHGNCVCLRPWIPEFDRFWTQFLALPVVVGARRWHRLIRCMQFFYQCSMVVSCKLAPFLRLLPLKCKILHFSVPHSSSFVDFGITGYYDTGQLLHAVNKTPTCLVMCPFPLFIALCDHNPPTFQADGQTVRKISMTCIYCMLR